MGHFAQIDENNIVTQVIVAEQDFVNNLEGTWVQTSYNTRANIHYSQELDENNKQIPSADQTKALRKNFAGIGYIYDSNRDAFIPPKPYNSWIVNETTCQWEAPVPYPDGALFGEYDWNENTQSWDLITT